MHRSPHDQSSKRGKHRNKPSACAQLSTSQERPNTRLNAEKSNISCSQVSAQGCGERRKTLISNTPLWAYPVDKMGNSWGQPERHFQLRGSPQTNSPNDGRRLFSFESLKTMKGISLWGERKQRVLYFCFVLPPLRKTALPSTRAEISVLTLFSNQQNTMLLRTKNQQRQNSTTWLISTIHPDRATRTKTTSPAPSKLGSSSAW